MSKQPVRSVQPVRFKTERMKEIARLVYKYFEARRNLWVDDSPWSPSAMYIQRAQDALDELKLYDVKIIYDLSTVRYVILPNGQAVNHGILIRAWKAHEMEQI